MNKWWVALNVSVISFNVQAFPCYLTVAKDSCWQDYNVKITAIDTANSKELVTINIPEGKAWGRGKFECAAKQVLAFRASFTPVFWQNDVGKVYFGQHYWVLPYQTYSNETAWNINLCYPEQFAEVPLPPVGGENCKCNMQDIPPVGPTVIEPHQE